MKLSEKFTKITNQTGLYNIQAINNIPSIMRVGLLSCEKAQKINHVSIAMNEVQSLREQVKIPGGLNLHQYANLYFDPRNPMLSKRRNQNEEICILKFNRAILDLEGVILSDRNASSKYVKFYRVKDGLEKINFDLVYAKYWTDSDYLNQSIKKSIKCAEVLVPYCIPFNYVVCAAVVSRNSENKLKAVGFNKSIFIKPEIFFRSW